MYVYPSRFENKRRIVFDSSFFFWLSFYASCRRFSSQWQFDPGWSEPRKCGPTDTAAMTDANIQHFENTPPQSYLKSALQTAEFGSDLACIGSTVLSMPLEPPFSAVGRVCNRPVPRTVWRRPPNASRLQESGPEHPWAILYLFRLTTISIRIN